MNYQKNGFTCIECIISLSIICIATYIVSTSIYSSLNLVKNNEINIDMLNLANSQLQEAKKIIKNSELDLIENFSKKEKVDKYDTETSIIKEKEYYQCYKINIKVIANSKILKLDGYATK